MIASGLGCLLWITCLVVRFGVGIRRNLPFVVLISWGWIVNLRFVWLWLVCDCCWWFLCLIALLVGFRAFGFVSLKVCWFDVLFFVFWLVLVCFVWMLCFVFYSWWFLLFVWTFGVFACFVIVFDFSVLLVKIGWFLPVVF